MTVYASVPMFHVQFFFSDIFIHVDSETRFFNRDQFLDDIDDVERPFYEKVNIFCFFFSHSYEHLKGVFCLKADWKQSVIYYEHPTTDTGNAADFFISNYAPQSDRFFSCCVS